VIGIELITIDARIVIASVDTYLRFAEAVNRLDLTESGGADLTDLRGKNGDAAKEKVSGAKEKLSGAGEKVKDAAENAKEKVSGRD
jgi:gas vesicle structural protein